MISDYLLKISSSFLSNLSKIKVWAAPSSTPSNQNVSVTLQNPLALGEDLNSILGSIGNWLILIGAPIAVFMILVGGFQILTSGGEPEKWKRGRSTILWTIVGYAILLLGTEIAKLISEFFK